MPDTPQQQNPTIPATPPSSTPPSGTPTKDSGAELSNMVAPEYRYPDNETVPEYLRGKTAADAAQLLQGLVSQVGRGAAQPQQQELPPPQDDEYVTAAHLRQAQQQAVAQMSPWLATVADQQATMSYNLAKREDAEIFKKYEPEIISVLQRIPRQNWTLDAVKNAVTYVKGNHVNELLAEHTRKIESTMAGTMRSTGRAGSPTDSPNPDTIAARLAKTPASWLARANRMGINETDVLLFCQANDMTADEFFKQFEHGIVSEAVAELNIGGSVTLRNE